MRRKGVSAIIGAMFLIAIVFVAYAIGYSYFLIQAEYSEETRAMIQREWERVMENFFITRMTVLDPPSIAELALRNDGQVMVEVSAVYVLVVQNNTLRVYGSDRFSGLGRYLEIGENGTIQVVTDFNLRSGHTYVFYVASARGNVGTLRVEWRPEQPPLEEARRAASEALTAAYGPVRTEFPQFLHIRTGLGERQPAWHVIRPPPPRRIIFYIRLRNFGNRTITLSRFSHILIQEVGRRYWIVGLGSTLGALQPYDAYPITLQTNPEGRYWEGGPTVDVPFAASTAGGVGFGPYPPTGFHSVTVAIYYHFEGDPTLYAYTITFTMRVTPP